jgi:hypothetical protein
MDTIMPVKNKNALFYILLCFSLVPLFPQNRVMLDDAIDEFATSLVSEIPYSKGIAVIAFEADTQDLKDYFFSTMEEKLWEKRGGAMAILERRNFIQDIQRELEFSLSLFVSEETEQRIGRAIGADTLIYGSISKVGNEYRMTLRATNVETRSFLFLTSYDLIIDSRLAGLLGIRPPIFSAGKEARLWMVGASVGTSFTAPWFIGTVHGTIAPLSYSFLEIGFDSGLISGVADVGYYSLYPYAHYALFLPFPQKGGWYIGAGGGYMIAELDYPEGKVPQNTFVAGFTTGFNIGNMFDISYTLRTNFKAMDNKVSAGYTYRFK